MKSNTYLVLYLPFAFILLSLQQPQQTSSMIRGVVISEQTGQPLSGAHVYVIHGEEETLTNKKGEFQVESWQKFPLKLTVEYRNFLTTSVGVADPGKRQVIRLKSL